MHRIKRFTVYGVLFVFLTIEEVALHHLSIKNILPDTLVVFVVFLGLFYGARLGTEAGLICGLIKDILGVGVFGLNTVLFGLIGFTCGMLSDKVYKENILTYFSIVFTASFIISGMRVPHALYTSLVSPFIILLLQRVFKVSEEAEGWRY